MSNNTTKVNNPMKAITVKDNRWSYANVWEAKSINNGEPRFSVSLIIPKEDVKTVERIIGHKPGTGGTSGVSYLAKALELRFFPELWQARTSL